MNYEQRYKEALEAVKELQEANPSDDGIKNWVEEKFPELKESGDYDERIRKALIDGFKRYDYGALFNGCFVREILPWLEKQGDINRRIQEEVEKQTRQQEKPEMQGDNVSGECNDTALEETLKIWFKKGKCSGIDEVIFHPQKYGLEKQCGKPQGKSALETIKEEKVDNRNYIKPAEWSEEDEKRLNSCLNVLQPKTLLGNTETINTKWLKSLKERVQPQNHWKPSEELIKALEKTLIYFQRLNAFGETIDNLKELHQQIKNSNCMKASECKCVECGKQAVAFWPVCDPDIPSYPYCRECLDKAKRELMIKLEEIDKKYKK